MKKSISIFIALYLFLMIPISAFADDLAEVKQSGVLRFGTSSEYVPFVFYDNNDVLTGIDVELVREIGKRLGVTIKTYDLAFDGLLDAVSIGQVDLIGGALSKTDSRAQQVDFSRVYYAGNAVVVARSGSQVPATNFSNDFFKGKKIGVQRGTSFESWVNSNLISAGLASTKDLFTYHKEEDVFKALSNNDIDLIIVDQDVFDSKYAKDTSFVKITSDIFKENYAFAGEKGSTLIPEVNNILSEMIKDGTAQKIANVFFSMSFDASNSIQRPSQIITVVPTPAPTAVVPVPKPSACVNAMSFQQDITITDGHQVNPGERFTKTWRVYNNGTCTWNSGYSLVYTSGDLMSGNTYYFPQEVRPGQSYDISVPFISPYTEGTYKGYWQMRGSDGRNFGTTIWVKVRVKGNAPAPTSGPRPTATPKPTQAPGPMLPVSIDVWMPDYYTGNMGDCMDVYWMTTNAYTQEIYLNGSLYSAFSLPVGSTTICFNSTGTFTMRLRAYNSSSETSSQFDITMYPPLMTDIPNPTSEPWIDPVIYDDDEEWIDYPVTDEEVQEILDDPAFYNALEDLSNDQEFYDAFEDLLNDPTFYEEWEETLTPTPAG